MATTLDNKVLVLNRLWQPVNTCSARRAVNLLCLGHAQVVRADEENNFYTHDFWSWIELSSADPGEDVVRSVSRVLRIPQIIVLSLFDRLPKKQVKFTRENIYRRDGYRCQYCGKSFEARDLNLDHVIPRDKGGRTTWENVVCSCIRCNTRKANKLPAEAGMFPRNQPRSPSWRPLFSAASVHIHYDSWSHFIELKHSAVEVSE